MPYALQRLFVTILLFCEPSDVRSLWNQFHTFILEDYTSTYIIVSENFIPMLLRDLNDILIQHGKTTKDFDLPSLTFDALETTSVQKIIQGELSKQIPNEDVDNVHRFNHDQLIAFNTILDVTNHNQSQAFFVDEPGGTSKTFVYCTLIEHCRSKGQIILPTTSSGIATTLLPSSRTAHSRFKIPINVEAGSFCFISKQSNLAKLIKKAKAIIWDEAPMIN